MDLGKLCKLEKICLEKRENEFSEIILELIENYVQYKVKHSEDDMNKIEKEDMGYDR